MDCHFTIESDRFNQSAFQNYTRKCSLPKLLNIWLLIAFIFQLKMISILPQVRSLCQRQATYSLGHERPSLWSNLQSVIQNQLRLRASRSCLIARSNVPNIVNVKYPRGQYHESNISQGCFSACYTGRIGFQRSDGTLDMRHTWNEMVKRHGYLETWILECDTDADRISPSISAYTALDSATRWNHGSWWSVGVQ